ncbi:MAG: DNA recombination and repair protein RecF, partial [uncultured Solirubrobacteraceae bacterium]
CWSRVSPCGTSAPTRASKCIRAPGSRWSGVATGSARRTSWKRSTSPARGGPAGPPTSARWFASAAASPG